MRLRLSNSKIESGEDCLYKLYLESICKIVPSTKSSALLHGSAWHKIMEAFYLHIQKNGWHDTAGAVTAAGLAGKEFWTEAYETFNVISDYRNLETEMSMFLQYLNHFKADENFLEVVSVEQKLASILPRIFRSGMIDEITYSGVIDMRVLISGIPWIIDHKTTASYAQRIADNLNRSNQFIGYAYLEKQEYDTAEGAMANIAKCSARKKKDGDWGKLGIDFLRPVQVYTDKDFENFIIHTEEFANRVAYCVDTTLWPKNYSACYNYGRCRMYSQCMSGESEPIDGYMLNPEAQSELLY